MTLDDVPEVLTGTLDRELAPGTLLAMVEFDANTGLDDASDVGARAWLETLARDLRTSLENEAPPARGTHQLDRDRGGVKAT